MKAHGMGSSQRIAMVATRYRSNGTAEHDRYFYECDICPVHMNWGEAVELPDGQHVHKFHKKEIRLARQASSCPQCGSMSTKLHGSFEQKKFLRGIRKYKVYICNKCNVDFEVDNG